MNSWPDAGMTPFRSEKNTNWEGAFRVPQIIRWPGRSPPGVVSNEIVEPSRLAAELLAAAGEPDIKQKLLDGHEAGDKTFKVHLDGYNLLPYLTGETGESPRNEFFYFSDDGDLVAFRFDNWKFVFMQQRVAGRLRCGASRSSPPVSRTSTTCVPTRSSAPTSPPTPTGTGTSIAPSSWCPHRPSWASS